MTLNVSPVFRLPTSPPSHKDSKAQSFSSCLRTLVAGLLLGFWATKVGRHKALVDLLQTSDIRHPLRSSVFGLRSSNFGLPTSHFPLPTSHFFLIFGQNTTQDAYMISKPVNQFLGLALLIVVLLPGCSQKATEEIHPPNIVVMLSDDHAYQAISAYGYGLNQTPNIDRLGEEGAIFTRATVTNSICAPSRAVILTGKHSFINGKVDNLQPFDWDQDNFAKMLQKSGYSTAMIGKIHLDGLPQGFDHSMVLPGQGEYYNPDFLVNGERQNFEGYVTEITTEYALKWLEEGRDKDKPFLLIYNQKAPHRNWKPAPKYLTLFDDKTFDPPATFFDDYTGRGEAARSQEMEIAGHGLWGHDFKLKVDPDGNETGFSNQLKRLNEEQLRQWEEAYEPKNKAFLEANLEGEELAIWKR